jgi:hypothetical protein
MRALQHGYARLALPQRRGLGYIRVQLKSGVPERV